MQYILSEEEYNNLTEKKESAILLEKNKLQKLCTEIAITMPLTIRHDKKEVRPWGCILDKEHDSWYCDQCPVRIICPNDHKKISK